MYNLFVRSGDDWVDGIMMIPRDRFLLCTDDDITDRFDGPSRATFDELTKFPALFTSEMPTKMPAMVGWIRKIKDQQSMLRVEFAPDEAILTLPPEDMEELLLELDIRRSERSTTHWAVKDVDLFKKLQKRGSWPGFPVDPTNAEFSRKTVVCACNLLERQFTHAKLTQFLQEIGMEHSPAATKVGGLAVRLTELSGHAIAFPHEETASGEPLAYAIVIRAAQLDSAALKRELVPDQERPARRDFLQSLAKDGYVFAEPALYSSTPSPNVPARPVNVLKQKTGRDDAYGVSPPLALTNATGMPMNPKVFVVHGRDDAAKHEVARFLERIGLEATILHEQPNAGRTLITKFQEVAKDVAFAIVLMTPDDEGALAGELPQPRARQNVVFELGFFLGKMPAGRVCALVKGDVERPSDFEGVAYIQLDANGGWKTHLARELAEAQIPFNEKKVFY